MYAGFFVPFCAVKGKKKELKIQLFFNLDLVNH
jgi:hypothetical protein